MAEKKVSPSKEKEPSSPTKDKEPTSPLKEGRARSHSQDEELQAMRRRQESISFDYVAGLEQLSEDNMHAIRSLFNRHLHCTLAKELSVATERDYYLSLAYAVRDHVMSGWFETQQAYYSSDPKVLFQFKTLLALVQKKFCRFHSCIVPHL